MESYLMITQINDFVFCPRSIYFHDIYRNTADTDAYHQTPQIIGQASHKTVDEGTYSSRRDVITGLMVYSEKYCILGRIDVLNLTTGLLTERKHSVTAVYDGFRFQLYGQYFALREMGYPVAEMRIHSVKDNKNYGVAIPGQSEIAEFENTLDKLRSFSLFEKFEPNPAKCAHCIYSPLCDACPNGEEHP